MRFNVFLMIGVAFILFCHSCNTCNRRHTVEDVTIDWADLVMDSTYVNIARKVFYALPTPIEMTLLIKNSGIPWRPVLLNDPVNASKYLSSQKMALNFGVYTTNLTYSGLFEQSQMVLRYKLAISQLIEGLGLQSAINTNTMQLIEQNINDKDMILRIIADTYASCAAFLDEGDRYYLVLAILAGGWVESMYIATNTLNENLLANEEMINQLVIDQLFTFDIMWKVMSDFKDLPGVDELISSFSGLAQLFDKIGVHQTPNVVTSEDNADVSVIASNSAIDITPKDFENIRIQIQILRDNFIQI